MLTGASIGGLSKFSAEHQAKILTGIAQDSMGGQEGISGFTQASSGVQTDLKNYRDLRVRQAQLQAQQRAEVQAREQAKQQKQRLAKTGTVGRQGATTQNPLPPKVTQPLAVYDTNGLVTSDPAPSPFTITPPASGGSCGSLTSVLGFSVMQPPPNARGTDALHAPCEQVTYSCLNFPPVTGSVPGGACVSSAVALKKVQCRADWLKSQELRDYVGCLAGASSGDYQAYYTKVANLLR